MNFRYAFYLLIGCNVLKELKGNIRVYCRVRPVLDTDVITVEDAAHAENTLNIYGNSQLELIVPTMVINPLNNRADVCLYSF